ncbi:MAG: response regulator [Synechococcaceae cyanobacterium SM2_3_1]|nr:response regulator [Synechococcaceae cyanobacterium SM2_3_1]
MCSPAEATLLVIEDSVTQRQTVVLTLQKGGYRVIQAGHGLEGLEKLRRHPEIQAVVCDVEMPQMNGYEFLTACRQDPQLARLPVIMLTSRSGAKHRDRAFALGARDYLTKPCSSQELLAALGQLEAVR